MITHEPLKVVSPSSAGYNPPKSMSYKPESERRILMARLKQKYGSPGSQFLIDSVKSYEIQPQEVIDENFIFTPSSSSKAHKLKQKPSLSSINPSDNYNFLIKPNFVALGNNNAWN